MCGVFAGVVINTSVGIGGRGWRMGVYPLVEITRGIGVAVVIRGGIQRLLPSVVAP